MKNFIKRGRTGVAFALLAIIIVIYMVPLVITVTNSLMSSEEVEKHYNLDSLDEESFIDMRIVPEKVTLSQYARLLFGNPVYLHMLWNSVKLVLPIVLGQILVSVPAAYAFTVLKFRGKEVVFFFYIIVMLLPLQVVLVPNYMVADWLHLLESYSAIILPAIFHPLGVFLLRQYGKGLPDACIEAAKLDGAGHGRILLEIYLPYVKPGIAAVAMLTLLDKWNLVEQALLLISDAEAQPLSVFLEEINRGEMGLAYAGSCFYAIPVLIILFYGQETLRNTVAATGMRD